MSKERSLFCAVNRKEDEAESGLKEKHVPTLTAPDAIQAGQAFDLKIDCWGGGKHPNEHGHFIQWVEVYAGEVFLTRVEFTAVVTPARGNSARDCVAPRGSHAARGEPLQPARHVGRRAQGQRRTGLTRARATQTATHSARPRAVRFLFGATLSPNF